MIRIYKCILAIHVFGYEIHTIQAPRHARAESTGTQARIREKRELPNRVDTMIITECLLQVSCSSLSSGVDACLLAHGPSGLMGLSYVLASVGSPLRLQGVHQVTGHDTPLFNACSKQDKFRKEIMYG